MTASRIIVPGATIAVTKRCAQRKAFLGPWHPEVSRIYAFAMARAQEKYNVEVHHATLPVNHVHASVTATENNLPLFIAAAHGDASKGIGTLLARNRYDTPGEIFDARKPHYTRLMDAEAQATRLTYDNLNPVTAGLVARPEDMPGQLFTFNTWLKGYIDVPKPSVYFGRREPDVRRLIVTPPPLLYLAFGGDIEKIVYHMNRLTDEGVRVVRNARKRPPMGAREVRRIHPWGEPKTLCSDSGQPNETFAWGARNAVTRERNILCKKEVRGFRRQRNESLEAWRGGDREVSFPYGTYAMVAVHSANVKPGCELDALVSRPGPTLEDARAMLAGQSSGGPIREEAVVVVETTREVLSENIERVCQEEQVDLASKDASPAMASRDGDAADPKITTGPTDAPVVRHRFDRQVRAGTTRRVITLRDKRRGRPKKRNPQSGSHGSDPPA